MRSILPVALLILGNCAAAAPPARPPAEKLLFRGKDIRRIVKVHMDYRETKEVPIP
jgi:hypothetical protein